MPPPNLTAQPTPSAPPPRREGARASGTAPSEEGAFIFLSQLLGVPVRLPDGAVLGRLADLLVDPGHSYPPVTALRVRLSRSELRRVSWEDVVDCATSGVTVRSAEALVPLLPVPPEIPLAQDVLDRQIVDTDGAKVKRVNDLHLVVARGGLRVAHVDVGFRGLVRRMGWELLVDGAIRLVRSRAGYLRAEEFLSWKHVQPLAAGVSRVRLDVARSALAELHPADLAEILADLDRRERAVLFRELPVEAAAEALEEAEPELQRELLGALPPDRAADIVEAMEPDDAADLIGDLPRDESEQLLAAMEAPEAREVQQLLRYDESSAGGLMTPDFLQVPPGITVAQALVAVREQARTVEHVHDVFVIGSDRRLAGALSIRDLLLANPDQPVDTAMHEHPAPLVVDDGARKVAELTAKYALLSLPVLDVNRRVLGVVTIDDVLEKVLDG